MRSLVLLLVGVAAVAALPLDDAATPSSRDELLHQLLQAKPEDNDIIQDNDQDKLPSSSSPSSPPPSPTSSPSTQDQKLDPTPAGQVSTPSGEQADKNEEKQEEETPKESDTQEEGQEVSVDPSTQTDEVEEEPVVVIEPLPVEPEVERVSPGYNVEYVVVEEDTQPIIQGQVDDGPAPPEDEEEELLYALDRERTALIDELHWPEEVPIMELPEGQVDLGLLSDEPEADLPLAPEPEMPFEPQEDEYQVEPEMEPLPVDYEEAVVDPGFDFPASEGSEDPAYPPDVIIPDYDPQDEEYHEDDMPMGFFSWVLPGFIDDRIITDSETNGEELPIIDVPMEHDIEEEEDEDEDEEEEDFFPEAAPVEEDNEGGIVVFEENGPMDEENGEEEEENGPYDEENGPEEENGPYEEENGLNGDEEDSEGRNEEEREVVYFRPDNFGMSGEDMHEDPVYVDYGRDDNVPEGEYYFPEEDEELVLVDMPEDTPEMMPPGGVMILNEDEQPTEEYHPIIFPDFNEDEVNDWQEPYMPEEEYSYNTEDSPLIIEPPHEYSYDTEDSPLIVEPPRDFSGPILPSDDRIPLRDILFPIIKMVGGDLVDVVVTSSPPEGSKDTEPSLLPIAGDQMMPDNRPVPIAAYTDHDEMNQQPQWTPNHNSNSPPNNNSPHNSFSVFYDQWSNKGHYPSFRESQAWPQRQAPFRNNMEGNMNSHLPPHSDMHFHSHYDDYHPDFGYSHSYGPVTPARPFFRPINSPRHYHRQDGFSQRQSPFSQGPRVTHSEYNVFQSGPQFRPEQDIYPSGPQDPFYQTSDFSHRPSPFTSFRRPQREVDVDIMPLEMTIYPDTHAPFSSPRQQLPFFFFSKEQPAFHRDTFTPSHNDMAFHQPKQSYTGSTLYPNFPHPFARYAPGYP